MQVIKGILSALRGKSRKKRVVYTCLFGFSETFMDRSTVDDGITDYICFTDDKTLTSKNWRFIYVDTREYGPQKTSKLIKTRPHLFLGGYESSLYIDNTVRINVEPDQIWSYLSDETPFVMYKHPFWDCPYKETDAVIQAGYANRDLLSAQISTYESEGLPQNVGLYHGGVLLRKHHDERVQFIDDKWFQEIQKYTYRDQVALSYLVWKLPFRLGFFPGSATDDELVYWPDDVGPRLPRGFDDKEYLLLNSGIDLQGMTPREHYFKVGMAQGLPWNRPSIPDDFDDAVYLTLHPDVAAAGMNAREHYALHGFREGRDYKHRRKVYIDLGSNHGLTVEDFMRDNSGFVAFAFEPAPQLAEEIRDKFKDNPAVTIFEAAAWIANDPVTFYPGALSDESSTLLTGKSDHSPWKIDYDNGFTVQAIDIAHWVLSNTTEDDIVIMKMDVEGSEYRLLPHLIETGVVQRLKEIRVEWHWDRYPLEVNEEQHNAIRDKLKTFVPVVDWH